MDLSNSFVGRTNVPEHDNMRKIIAALETEKILTSKIERLLSAPSGFPLVQGELKQFFGTTYQDIARMEIFVKDDHLTDERIRGLFQMKCSALLDKCKAYGFPRLGVACRKLLRANKRSDNVSDKLAAVKNEFLVLADGLRPALGTIEFLHELVDMVVTDFGPSYDTRTLNLDGRERNTTAPTSVQNNRCSSCVIM